MATQTQSAIPELHRKFLETFDKQLQAAREEKPAGADLDAESREALLAGFRERLGALEDRKKRALARFDEEIANLQGAIASLEKGGPAEPKRKYKGKKSPQPAAAGKKGG